MIIGAVASFVRQTSEFKNWGRNASTTLFFLTMGATLVELWGTGNQIATLFSPATQSAAGVSITMKVLTSIFYFSTFSRSVKRHDLALTIASGCISFSFILIILGLWIIKGFTWYEWFAFTFALLAIGMAFTEQYREFIYNGIITFIFFVLLVQPVEMVVRHSAAGLNPWDPFGFLVSCLIWTFYGLSVKNKKVAWSSAVYACTYTTSLVLWWYFTKIGI